MTTLISANKLSFKMGTKNLLQDISFTLDNPKIVGVLSPNGHGKTTLCRCLSGVYPVKKDMIHIYEDNKEIKNPSIAYLEANFNLPNHKSIRKSIKYYKELFPDFDQEKCERSLDKFQINQTDSINSLSLGNKQLFYLSLILSRQSKIVILDEPLSNVDVLSKDRMIQMILDNYSEDTYIFIATHYLSEMEKLFDHVLFLKDGKLIINEDADTLRNERKQSIENIFKEVYSK